MLGLPCQDARIVIFAITIGRSSAYLPLLVMCAHSACRAINMLRLNMQQEQADMRGSIDPTDAFSLADLSRIGGLDIRWVDDNNGIGALVVLSWPSLELVFQHTISVSTQVP